MKCDKLILDKVLSNEMQHLAYLLSSLNHPLQKAESYYKVLHQRNVTRSTAIGKCNLETLFKILEKPLMLPELDSNGHFKEAPVFISLSSKLKQNIILFARRFKFDFDYDAWTDFLRRNFAFLDTWCKVIVKDEVHHDSSFSCLSNQTINDLHEWHDKKFSNVKQFHERDKARRKSEVSSPPKKRQRCQSPDDFFLNDDLDENEMISACEKTEMEYNLSRSSGTENQRNETIGSEAVTDNISPFIGHNISLIERLAQDFPTETSVDIMQLFVDCPLQSFSDLLNKLKVGQWDMNLVLSLIKSFVADDSMSFEKMRVFVSQSVTSKLNDQKGSISRELYQVILDIFGVCKRASITSIVGECLLFEDYRNVHTDVINKLFSDNVLNTDDINTILEFGLSRRNFAHWNEEFLTTLDILIATKANLTDNVKLLLVSSLVTVTEQFKKSLKLMKLVITFAQIHQTDFSNRFKDSMKIVIDKNETFLKKKALKLL